MGKVTKSVCFAYLIYPINNFRMNKKYVGLEFRGLDSPRLNESLSIVSTLNSAYSGGTAVSHNHISFHASYLPYLYGASTNLLKLVSYLVNRRNFVINMLKEISIFQVTYSPLTNHE